MAGKTLSLGELFQDTHYVYKTCGMHKDVVAGLRKAYASQSRITACNAVCENVLRQLMGVLEPVSNVAVIMGTPLGKPLAAVAEGDVGKGPKAKPLPDYQLKSLVSDNLYG